MTFFKKVPMNKFDQRGKDLYFKNYRTQMKEIEDDTNKWKAILCS